MHGKSREDCAAILGVSLHSIDRWCVGLESKRHADMALGLWERLNVYLNQEFGIDIKIAQVELD